MQDNKKECEFSLLRQKTGLSLNEFAEKSGYQLRTVYRWENGEYIPKLPVIKMLKGMIDEKETRKRKNKHFTFIDLFAGIGGIRKAFESVGGECIFTSEWNEESLKTYRANFSCTHPIAGDITKVDAKDIPAHDVLVAGFPCQPFSIAGVSKKNSLGKPHGFLCETQGTLFFDIARIIDFRKPKAFLLENVKNLVSHDNGKTFEVIRKTLQEDLGYSLHWKIINAKGWLPQNRQRIFIVGFKDENEFSFDKLHIPDPEHGPRLSSILHPEDGTEIPEGHFTEGSLARVSDKYTLSEKLWNYLKAYAEKHKAQGNGFGFGLCTGNDVARTLSARYYKDGSEILIAQKRKRPRRLTPRECARLMGFDDENGRFIIPVSDTQAYKQFGNSVAVPAVKAVARHMAPFLVAETNARRLRKIA